MSARHQVTTFLVARGATGGALIAAVATCAALATAATGFNIVGYLLSMLVAALVGAIIGCIAAALLAFPVQYRPQSTAFSWSLATSAGLLIGAVAALLALQVFNGPEISVNLIAASVGIASAAFASFVVVRARHQAQAAPATS